MFSINFATIFSDIFGYGNPQEPKGFLQSIWDAVCAFFQREDHSEQRQPRPLQKRIIQLPPDVRPKQNDRSPRLNDRELHTEAEIPAPIEEDQVASTPNNGILDSAWNAMRFLASAGYQRILPSHIPAPSIEPDPQIDNQVGIFKISPYQEKGLCFKLLQYSKGILSVELHGKTIEEYERGNPGNPGIRCLHPLCILVDMLTIHRAYYDRIMNPGEFEMTNKAAKSHFLKQLKQDLDKFAGQILDHIPEFAHLIGQRQCERALCEAAQQQNWDAFLNILEHTVPCMHRRADEAVLKEPDPASEIAPHNQQREKFLIPEASEYQLEGLRFTIETISQGMSTATINSLTLRSYEKGEIAKPGTADLHPLRFLGEIMKSHKKEFVAIMTTWGLVVVKKFFVDGLKKNLTKHATNIPDRLAEFVRLIGAEKLENDLRQAAQKQDWNGFINILVEAAKS